MSSVLTAPAVRSIGVTTWDLDSIHSQAQFAVRHMMISTVRGEFGKITGTLTLDEEDVSRSTLEVRIDVDSISTREADRDTHLKSSDFLDVANFPTIRFTSTRVTKDAHGRLKVAGDLTIRDATREIMFDVDGPTLAAKDPWGNLRIGASAGTRINRKDFGLTWNAVLETGGVLVGDEVGITLDVEFIRRTSTPDVR